MADLNANSWADAAGTGAPSATFGVKLPVASYSANQTLSASDYLALFNPAAATITATLPTAVGITGRKFIIKNIGTSTGQVNVATTSSQTINGRSMSGTSQIILQPYGSQVQVVSDGANWTIEGETEVTAARYYCNTGHSVLTTTHTAMINLTKVYDTHNQMNTSTGAYTCPSAGLYSICGQAAFDSGLSSSKSMAVGVMKNGSMNHLFNMFITNGSPARIGGGSVIRVAAGDTLGLSIYHDQGSTLTTGADSQYTWLAITRIGD